MKIVSLQAENIKRIVAIEIKPNGNVVEITGKNASGKTSTLDSLWWCLAGTSNIQGEPIRRGADSAKIKLDMGDVIATRTFKKTKDGETTSSIVVENSEGAKFPSPQTMLDSLMGSLSFDPLSFSRMSPKEQFNALRKFVPNVDFDAIESANKKEYDTRTLLNRQIKEYSAVEENMPTELPLDSEPKSEEVLIDTMSKASVSNSEIRARKTRREIAAQELLIKSEQALQIEQEIKEHSEAIKSLGEDEVPINLKEMEISIQQVKEQLDKIQKEYECAKEFNSSLVYKGIKKENQTKLITEKTGKAASLRQECEALNTKLNNAEPLPQEVDIQSIQKELNDVREYNEKVRTVQKKKEIKQKIHSLVSESEKITNNILAREKEKQEKISLSKLPVEGLSFGEGIVLLNGIPIDQASDAEQLRASIAIAMASNSKLRVVRVRDGSLLDEESMKVLSQMAEDKDYQVWIERVDSSGKIGFVIEDGQLKKQGEENV